MNIRYPIYEGVYRILTIEETGERKVTRVQPQSPQRSEAPCAMKKIGSSSNLVVI